MTIERAELFPLRLSLRQDFITAGDSTDARELAVLRLTDSEGNIGLGEVTPYPSAASTPLADLVRPLLDGALSRIEGVEVDRCADVLSQLADELPLPTFAALDTALLDLDARRAGLPLAKLLEPNAADAVIVNATIASASPDSVGEQAAAAAAAGFTTIKLKVGMTGDLWRVSAARDAIGWDVRLRIDANGAWYSAEAIEQLAELAQFGIELVEQPVRRDDLVGMNRVREAVALPVVADEGVRTLDQLASHVEHAACDGIAVKLAQVGGIGAAGRLVDRASAAGLFCLVTSTLDGPVGLAAGLHFAAARPEIELACGLATADIFTETCASGLPEALAGRIKLTDRPGLGVELSDDLLAEFALEL